MGYQKRDFSSGKSFGGGKFGGGFKKRGFGDRGGFDGGAGRNRFGDKPQMHSATCAECGNACEVPFRPNGRKPVLCTNCFKRDEGGFDAKPRFGGRTERPSFGGGSNDNTAEQLRTINRKLDQILSALKASDSTDDFSL